MSDSFNGYHVWLGIPPGEQPPNHYRLLGIALFETDLDVIDHAADRQMAHVRTFQGGRHAALSQQILNELAAARVCLLNAARKAEYDRELRAKLDAARPAVLVGTAVPVAQPAVALPRATPVAPVAQRVAAPLAVTPVGGSASDDIDNDLDGSVPLASRVDDDELLDEPPAAPIPTIKLHGRGRLVDRDARLMRAMVFVFTGVVVLVGVLVLYEMLVRLVDMPNLWQLLSTPESTAPADPAAETGPVAPAAPPPAPPAT